MRIGYTVKVIRTGEIGTVVDIMFGDFADMNVIEFNDDSSVFADAELVRVFNSKPEPGDYLGTGKDRRTVYIGNGFVRKFPKDDDGIQANHTERDMWLDSLNPSDYYHQKLAPCRLLKDNSLIMRYVDCNFSLDYDWDSLPDWTHGIDCQQVGFYQGRIVAYDYAG